MSVVINGFNKPTNCLWCPFNYSDYCCKITKGGIDRDNYSCDLPCPIEPLDTVLDKIRTEIDHMHSELTSDGRRMVRREKVLQIIDKNKAESEVRNEK